MAARAAGDHPVGGSRDSVYFTVVELPRPVAPGGVPPAGGDVTRLSLRRNPLATSQ
jgi:hypothetical protein